jgi:hypothetical protein
MVEDEGQGRSASLMEARLWQKVKGHDEMVAVPKASLCRSMEAGGVTCQGHVSTQGSLGAEIVVNHE